MSHYGTNLDNCASASSEAKKAKLASGASGKVPERVRVSHILLRWTGIKEGSQRDSVLLDIQPAECVACNRCDR
eukprot:1022472-Amphidinium_carterae.1